MLRAITALGLGFTLMWFFMSVQASCAVHTCPWPL